MKTNAQFSGRTFDGDSITLENGLTATVTFPFDDNQESPWLADDGHGDIEERRENWAGHIPTAPGERVLWEDRGRGYVYDVKGTLNRARKEGWGVSETAAGGLTKRQITALAVEKDFQRMRAWLNDEWSYIGVVVMITDEEGEELSSASVWGVESDDYLTDIANEVLDEATAGLPSAIDAALADAQNRATYLTNLSDRI